VRNSRRSGLALLHPLALKFALRPPITETMNAIWAPFVAVAAVFLAVAGGAAWWHQHNLIAKLKRRLRESENSRHEMAERAISLRRRADGTPAPIANDMAQRRQALERALDPAPPGEFPWLETMPAVDAVEGPGFEPTQPDHQALSLDLNLEEMAAR